MLRVPGFSLEHNRLPEGEAKESVPLCANERERGGVEKLV